MAPSGAQVRHSVELPSCKATSGGPSLMPNVTIIGAGLAGSEAAWQAAERGCSVQLWEMRPVKETPAHRTENFAELVCSNSLGNRSLETASGLLKEELRRLGSV